MQCRLRGAVAFAWSRASVIISITRGGDKLVVAHGSQLTMILITTRESLASTLILNPPFISTYSKI